MKPSQRALRALLEPVLTEKSVKEFGVDRSENEQTSLVSRVAYDLIPDEILGVQLGNVGLSSPQLGSKDLKD